MLNDLLGWQHTMSLPKPTTSIGKIQRLQVLGVQCGILVSCLNDRYVFLLSGNFEEPFVFWP